MPWLLVLACAPSSDRFGRSRAGEPADVLVYNNQSEPEFIDPGQATGHPDSRIIGALFMGLTEYDPETLEPVPSAAVSWDPHPDGRGYTFHLREATWTDGSPVTAHDFAWSWERVLHPAFLARYAQQLYAIQHAEVYNNGRAFLLDGQPVRVVSSDVEPFPAIDGRVVTAPVTLVDDEGRAVLALARGDAVILRPTAPDARGVRVYYGQDQAFGWLPEGALAHPRPDARVVVRPLDPIDWDGTGDVEAPGWTERTVSAAELEPSPSVLGFRARDARTLDVRLGGVAPYFLYQTSHTTLRAAPRGPIEAHGMRWTHPDHIVTNGPFILDVHKVRDRFELVRNDDWHGAADVRLSRIIAYSIDHTVTTSNLYRAGYTDLVVGNDLPTEFIPMLREKSDFHVSPAFNTYFYRINTTRPPLDDPRVRKALAMAVDRAAIVEVMKTGELPATHIVPPIPGYPEVDGPGFDPEAARKLLAEAGYPGGEGFREIEVLYNTLDTHKLVAAVIQDQWMRHLGVKVTLKNQEWKTYLKSVDQMDYDVARAGWIGDYVDPNTFLDLFVTNGGNNNTGWSDPAFDALIAEAAVETDPEVRLTLLAEAESRLNDGMPVLSLYWRVWVELRSPDVRGWHSNLLDQHPLSAVWLDR